MSELTLLEAVNRALAYELGADEDVVLLGEDIGVNGGVFRATEGLQARFGEDRVVDSPLAESLIAGIAGGMAAQGLRPVVEIQFMGFIYPAIDQILNHASRLRTRTRGRLSCPMVLRAPYGGGIHAPEHHSESTEAIFAHIPGLRVVIPSSPARAYGLLLAALRDPDPGVFLAPERVSFGRYVMADTLFMDNAGRFLSIVLTLNAILALFNLIPFPPLDGASAITLLLPEDAGMRLKETLRTGGIGMVGLLAAWLLFGQVVGPIWELLLRLVCRQAGYALRHCETHEKLRSSKHKTSMLLETALTICDEVDRSSILQYIIIVLPPSGNSSFLFYSYSTSNG